MNYYEMTILNYKCIKRKMIKAWEFLILYLEWCSRFNAKVKEQIGSME